MGAGPGPGPIPVKTWLLRTSSISRCLVLVAVVAMLIPGLEGQLTAA